MSPVFASKAEASAGKRGRFPWWLLVAAAIVLLILLAKGAAAQSERVADYAARLPMVNDNASTPVTLKSGADDR